MTVGIISQILWDITCKFFCINVLELHYKSDTPLCINELTEFIKYNFKESEI